MVQKGKLIVKERFNDGEIDLSMSDLDEVPVKEIAALKKTTSLDLSNNRLSALPPSFSTLTNLTKLDLSKNELTELPEDFGSLSKLKHLDLYKNNLERLPLSFGKLSALRFLDLKDNPLIPAIAKVAGPCVDNKGCQQCARTVVAFYSRLQEEVDNDLEMRKKARQKQLELNQQKKLEEKKKLKKEKQTNKAKKEVEKNNNKKSTTVVKKQIKKEQKKQKEKSGFLEQFFFFMLLSTAFITGSWYLYNYQYDRVKPVLELFKYYYQIFLDKLPDSGRYYLESVVESLDFVQQSTRNVTLRYIDVLKDSEMVQGIIFKVKDGISNIVGKFGGDKV